MTRIPGLTPMHVLPSLNLFQQPIEGVPSQSSRIVLQPLEINIVGNLTEDVVSELPQLAQSRRATDGFHELREFLF